MTTPRCDFLDHARLRHAPELRALAIDALFEVALRYGTRFRLEFDASRLLAVLGSAQAAARSPASQYLPRARWNDARSRLPRTGLYCCEK